jgi:hypothetical protein
MKVYHNVLLASLLATAVNSADCGEAPAPATAASTDVPAQNAGFSGKVIETMNAGGYTYVRVESGTNKIWAAAPKTEARVGDTVAIVNAMPMPNYHSKTLNRDFDVVYFAAELAINGNRATTGLSRGELPKNHPPITGAPGVSGAPAGGKIDLSAIKKPKGGKTIEEIFASKAKLSGHQVTVRGKVVKFNGMIMGKNWVHLRDGTGAQGSNDLLLTTTSEVKVGDTVVATGVVSLNKDFGSNYKYDVMLEDAKLVTE